MSSLLTFTVGVIPSNGGVPLFTSRTITYTSLEAAYSAFTNVLVNPPLLQYMPVPPPPPAPVITREPNPVNPEDLVFEEVPDNN